MTLARCFQAVIEGREHGGTLKRHGARPAHQRSPSKGVATAASMSVIVLICVVVHHETLTVAARFSNQNSPKLDDHSSAMASRIHLKSESIMKFTAAIKPMDAAPPINAPKAAPK